MDQLGQLAASQPDYDANCTNTGGLNDVTEYWIPLTLVVMGCVGFTGNFLSFILFVGRRDKTVTVFFAIYIAFSDWNENIVAIAFASWAIRACRWPVRTCYLQMLWRFWSFQTWLLACLLAINRYCAVIRPHEYETYFTRPRVSRMFVAIAVAAIIFAIPDGVICFDPLLPLDEYMRGYRMYNSVLCTVLVVCACVVMTFCYYNIIREMRRRSRDVRLRGYQPIGDGGHDDVHDLTPGELQRAMSGSRKNATQFTRVRLNDSQGSFRELASTAVESVGKLATNITGVIMKDAWSDDSNKPTELMFRNICLTFVFCSLPYQLYQSLDILLEMPDDEVTRLYLIIIQQVNFVMNPFFYYYYTPTFRETIHSWIPWRKKSAILTPG